jgi:hypothetical protein
MRWVHIHNMFLSGTDFWRYLDKAYNSVPGSDGSNPLHAIPCVHGLTWGTTTSCALRWGGCMCLSRLSSFKSCETRGSNSAGLFGVLQAERLSYEPTWRGGGNFMPIRRYAIRVCIIQRHDAQKKRRRGGGAVAYPSSPLDE